MMHTARNNGRAGVRLALLLLLPATVLAQRGRTPDWVHNTPIEPDFYFGIGMVTKRGHTTASFRDLARHRALRNLAMQISTQISSRFVINVVERTGLTQEEVESEILSRTEINLAGYELVDTYESRTEYWEYYRYSKAQHAAHTEALRQQAIATATVFLDEGETAADRREHVSALRLYVQTLVELQDYIGENNQLYARGHIAIERLLNQFRIVADRSEMPAVSGAAFREPLHITAQALLNGTPVPARNLPLAVTLDTHTPSTPVLMRAVTDQDGRVAVHIGRAGTAMHGHALQVAIDLPQLLNAEALPVFFAALMQRLTRPEARVSLRIFEPTQQHEFLWHWAFAGKTVAVYAACEADSEVTPWRKMHDALATRLQGAGATVRPGGAPLPEAVAWSAHAATGWPHDPDAVDGVIIAVATGRLNRRENPANPFGEDVQFAGEIRTATATAAQPQFTERYRGIGGWNPMGVDMCMDVMALHAMKRWEESFLRHLGER